MKRDTQRLEEHPDGLVETPTLPPNANPQFPANMEDLPTPSALALATKFFQYHPSKGFHLHASP